MTTESRISSIDADPTAYKAVTTSVAFLRNRHTDLVVARGTQVVQLLQGLVVNDVFQLAEPGSGQLNAAVNGVGRLLSLFHILHLRDLLILDLPEHAISSGLLAHFRNHVIIEDAKFVDKSAGIEKFMVAGPSAVELLGIIVRPERDLDSLPAYYCTNGALNLPSGDAEAIIVRTDVLNGINSFEMIVSAEDADAVESLFLTEGIPRFSVGIYDYIRLERLARARWGLELTDEVIPLEGDLNPIVSYQKGCYLGQEIIARLDSRNRYAKRLCTVQMSSQGVANEGESGKELSWLHSSVPAPGRKVFAFNEKKNRFTEVGEVIYGIKSEERGSILYRAYLARPAHELGTVVRLGGVEVDDASEEEKKEMESENVGETRGDKAAEAVVEGVVIQVADQIAEGVDP